jgi:hypothetical protein
LIVDFDPVIVLSLGVPGVAGVGCHEFIDHQLRRLISRFADLWAEKNECCDNCGVKRKTEEAIAACRDSPILTLDI